VVFRPLYHLRPDRILPSLADPNPQMALSQGVHISKMTRVFVADPDCVFLAKTAKTPSNSIGTVQGIGLTLTGRRSNRLNQRTGQPPELPILIEIKKPWRTWRLSCLGEN
jgi:hypothetical protein